MSFEEIISGPFEIYSAPVGTAFPQLSQEPAAPWVRLGAAGALNQSEKGISLIHRLQESQAVKAGRSAPAHSFFYAQELRVQVELYDLTLETYGRALGGNLLTETAPSNGVAGSRTVGLGVETRQPAIRALLLRGQSPYKNGLKAQFEVPRCHEAGQPSFVLRRGRPAGLAIEFIGLEDPGAVSIDQIFGRIVAEDEDALPGLAPSNLPPGDDWNGTAGSGFTTTPSDPTRTTAKPMARMLEPPLQAFTDELVVGVEAFANGGIARVQFNFEGRPFNVTTPSFRQFTREDGSTYLCLGYWINIKRPASIEGAADLYAEIFANDPTMQSRVIGPFTYFPVTTLHDMNVTVGAAGDHADLASAMAAVATAGAQRSEIKLIDNGDYTPGIRNYNPTQGYHKIVAADGVDARISWGAGNEDEWRPGFGNIWFEGLTIDRDTVFTLRNNGDETFVARHCRFILSGGAGPIFKTTYPAGGTIRQAGWFLENYCLGAHDLGISFGGGGSTLRGNISVDGTDDFAEQCLLTAYNIVDNYNWAAAFRPDLGRLRVQYSGSGTLIAYGRQNNDSGPAEDRTTTHVLKVDGVEVFSFTAWKHWSKHDAGDGLYTVEDFANALNQVSGWTATVLPDDGSTVADRAGNELGARFLNRTTFPDRPGDNFTDYEIGTDYTFICNVDLHEDGFASGLQANGENIIHAFNRVTRLAGQAFITNGCNDMAVVGNIFGQGQDAKTIGNSTIGDGNDYSHLFMVHNSWRGQYVRVLDSGGVGPGWDSYCTF
ncbi:MAG: hypothetical protein AAFQ13_00730, partial [Pseudomonadota bacterium]